MLFAAGMGLRWRIATSNENRVDMSLPAVPLTGNMGYEAFPTLSPEGTRVAYAWEQPGKQVPNIYVKLVGQGDPIRLTTNPRADFAPAWSPDGQWIAFLRARGPSHAAIMIIPSLGGQEREVAEISVGTDRMLHRWKSYEVPPPFLAWSPDARWLLTVEQTAPHETFSIVRVSVETGEKRTLTFPPKYTNGDGGLAVSPDGKTLAFTRGLGLFERDIYLVTLSQDLVPRGEPKRLTFDNKQVDGLAWTANGQSLIFSSERGGRLELWQMPARPGREPTRLTAAGEDPGEVVISRQGRHLVYSHPVVNWSIWRVPLRGKRPEAAQPLISSTRIEIQAKYSPDGKRIAFESNRSGHDEIWTCQADGSHPVQVTNFRAWAGSPRWSPDGQKLAFDSNAAGNWDIYVIGSQGTKPMRLTTSERPTSFGRVGRTTGNGSTTPQVERGARKFGRYRPWEAPRCKSLSMAALCRSNR